MDVSMAQPKQPAQPISLPDRNYYYYFLNIIQPNRHTSIWSSGVEILFTAPWGGSTAGTAVPGPAISGSKTTVGFWLCHAAVPKSASLQLIWSFICISQPACKHPRLLQTQSAYCSPS